MSTVILLWRVIVLIRTAWSYIYIIRAHEYIIVDPGCQMTVLCMGRPHPTGGRPCVATGLRITLHAIPHEQPPLSTRFQENNPIYLKPPCKSCSSRPPYPLDNLLILNTFSSTYMKSTFYRKTPRGLQNKRCKNFLLPKSCETLDNYVIATLLSAHDSKRTP
jgi:hypothetical protein